MMDSSKVNCTLKSFWKAFPSLYEKFQFIYNTLADPKEEQEVVEEVLANTNFNAFFILFIGYSVCCSSSKKDDSRNIDILLASVLSLPIARLATATYFRYSLNLLFSNSSLLNEMVMLNREAYVMYILTAAIQISAGIIFKKSMEFLKTPSYFDALTILSFLCPIWVVLLPVSPDILCSFNNVVLCLPTLLVLTYTETSFALSLLRSSGLGLVCLLVLEAEIYVEGYMESIIVNYDSLEALKVTEYHEEIIPLPYRGAPFWDVFKLDAISCSVLVFTNTLWTLIPSSESVNRGRQMLTLSFPLLINSAYAIRGKELLFTTEFDQRLIHAKLNLALISVILLYYGSVCLSDYDTAHRSKSSTDDEHQEEIFVTGLFYVILTMILVPHLWPFFWSRDIRMLSIDYFCLLTLLNLIKFFADQACCLFENWVGRSLVFEEVNRIVLNILTSANGVLISLYTFLRAMTIPTSGLALLLKIHFMTALLLHVAFLICKSLYSLMTSARLFWTVLKLSPATPFQLKYYKDTCPICHEVMNKAVVTKCGHRFHYGCLTQFNYYNSTLKCTVCNISL